jgi:pimeloyl-ACP methyl ester carboxylesterase
MKRSIAMIWVVAALLLGAAGARPAHAEDRISLPTRSGVTQSFYLTKPEGPAVASLILFPGGDGKLRAYGPAKAKRGNFLVRSRNLFVARGFIVAVMDAPSDQASGMDDFRVGTDHRRDIAAVIAYLRQAAPVPVWLVGTSRGTESAANGASLETGGPDGLVLTSSVTREGKRERSTVFDNDLGAIKVPTLLVHNRDDACQVCPFSDIQDLLDALDSAPRKELIAFEGGDMTLSEPCQALSRHGYIGIEDKVVAAIADWITRK